MSASPAQSPASLAPGSGEEFDARLLAEAVRCLEESQGSVLDEAAAQTLAQQAGANFEHRILLRAQHLSVSAELHKALGQLHRIVLITLGLTSLLALAAGLAAGSTALGATEAANVYWVLGSLLSLPTLTLLLWLGVWWYRPADLSGGILAGAVLAVARRLDRWLHRGLPAWAATRASVAVMSGTGLGRWLLSAISHGIWSLFLGGCLLMLVAVLAVRQYSFYWETTILSEESYIPLTRGLAWLPEQLGFPTPQISEIRASRWDGDGPTPRLAPAPWSGFLLGSLVVYGLLPRLLLLLLSLIMARRQRRRYRLDVALPGFERLRPRLMPVATALGVVDPDPGLSLPTPEPAPVIREGAGLPALVGLEIAPPDGGWPPAVNDIHWWDLGIINNREDHRRVVGELAAASESPRLLVVACSLATTPDRGIRNQLIRFRREAGIPLGLVLTEGQRLRDRGRHDEMARRIQDWRHLASEVGIDESRVVTVDLEHLTPASQTVLSRLAGGELARAANAGLGQAFSLIISHARQWSSTPEPAQQAALHQAILQSYRVGRSDWPGFARFSGDPRQLRGELADQARKLVDLLPGRLRQNPRWMATGAMTGALGCLAAASLMAPAAIAALPLWAGLGAAIAFAVHPGDASPAPTPPEVDLGEAVASAALFAVLLELQGMPEERITEILDQLLADQPPRLADAEAAAGWLQALRQRLDALRLELPS